MCAGGNIYYGCNHNEQFDRSFLIIYYTFFESNAYVAEIIISKIILKSIFLPTILYSNLLTNFKLIVRFE